MVRIAMPAAALAAVLLAPAAAAQVGPYDPLKRNVDAFTGMLEQALELDSVGGLFGLGGERIDNMYLAGHGVVLEVRSNLANARSRLNLAQLNSSVMALRQGDNPFAIIARSAQEEPESATRLTEADEQHPRFELLLRARDIDGSDAVDAAISQAGDYARILRDADGVDGDAFERLSVDIEALRLESQASAGRLRGLMEELRDGAAGQSGRFEQALGELSAEMRGLQGRAESLAEELRNRSERAQQERIERWREDVVGLERKLVQAMCDYGASLRELPADENVTVILSGLGEESSGGGRANLVHTFSKADLQLCEAGEIDSAALGGRSGSYSY